MIEFNTEHPTTEDFLDGIRRCVAQMNETLSDIQFLARRFSDGNYFMTENEVADYLRCAPNEIPKMPRFKPVHSKGCLYKKRDVDDFVETKALGRRKPNNSF